MTHPDRFNPKTTSIAFPKFISLYYYYHICAAKSTSLDVETGNLKTKELQPELFVLEFEGRAPAVALTRTKMCLQHIV
jgi:hypothetical protein